MTHSTFYDSKAIWGKPVQVRLEAGYIKIYNEAGDLEARWQADRLSRIKAKEAGGEFCLTLGGSARLILRDKALQEKLQEGTQPYSRLREDKKIIFYTLLGVVGGWLFFFQIIPLLSNPIVWLIPQSFDVEIGAQAYESIIESKQQCNNKRGMAALDKLKSKILDKELAQGITIAVVEGKEENAFALPGGHIIILSGLLDRARQSAMLEAILAHEVGHIEHRHAMRRLVSTATLGVLFALVVGDITFFPVVGQLAVNSYTHAMEKEADAYALAMMSAKGIDPKPLADWFHSLAEKHGEAQETISYFSTHPAPSKRALFFSESAWAIKKTLSAQEWVALKNICS